MSEIIDCHIYRCSRQQEMYLYLRADLSPEHLPEALRQRAGRLVQVLQLSLNPQRKLARVDVGSVMQQLREQGWYLQMPPRGQMQAHLHFGD